MVSLDMSARHTHHRHLGLLLLGPKADSDSYLVQAGRRHPLVIESLPLRA